MLPSLLYRVCPLLVPGIPACHTGPQGVYGQHPISLFGI